MQTLLWLLLFFIIIGIISGTFMFWSLQLPNADIRKKEIPYLSIIIPARNEALRLPTLLKSLQAQSWKNFEIIVVDDDSNDNTVTVAKSYGTKILKNKPVAELTSGKSVACAFGAKHAKGKWLMFLDADVHLIHKDSLLKILATYQRQNGTGILSIQPYHKIESTYENLSSIFNIIVITGINTFTIWKKKFKTAGSFGPCLLCNKENYMLTGGHSTITNHIMDDFALSDNFMDKHLPVTNFVGKNTVAMRMYPEGIKQLNEGWTKNLATASQSTHWLIMLFINLWIFGAICTIPLLVNALIIGTTKHLVFTTIVYLIYGIHTFISARRIGNFSVFTIILYPFLFLYFITLFLYSQYRTHVLRHVMWKGRKIKV